jgi:HK97 family phage prohead protease
MSIYTRGAAELIGVEQDKRIITVIAVPYDEPTQVAIDGQMWTEMFDASAFRGLTAAETVRVNRDHRSSNVVGKVVGVNPSDSRGLITELRIARTTLGDETLALADDDCLSASIGFQIRPDGEIRNSRARTRRVTRARLDHIALTADPAYVGARVLSVRNKIEPDIDIDADPVFAWARRHLARVRDNQVLRRRR